MGTICNGNCRKFGGLTGPRKPGIKACIVCSIRIDTEDIRCPCCKNKLRVKAHYSKGRTKDVRRI